MRNHSLAKLEIAPRLAYNDSAGATRVCKEYPFFA